jgi:enoyl-CoA hydratase/carnithine racemase
MTKTELANEPILLRAQHDAVVTLTLNRPRQANALSEAMLAALQAALDDIAADKGVRAVIIAGAGKAFCAGHDLKEMRAREERAHHTWLFKTCGRVMTTIARMPQPVIARVHGIATAAGCQLVAQCDLAIASIEAKFGTNGIDAGLFCTTPGVAVGRALGKKHALDLLLTGRFIGAAEAERIGLINRAVPASQLDAETAELARLIASKSGASVGQGKRVFHRQMELGLEAAYDMAGEAMAENMGFADAKEGIDAFIAKRPPRWTHR